MPHPVKTPVAFIPPLESPDAILIASTNIARAVGLGQLTDKQARNMNAALRMARWAIEQRAKAAADGNDPDPITDLPEAMSKALTAAHTEVEPVEIHAADETAGTSDEAATRKCGTDIPVGGRCEATRSSFVSPEDTRPNRNFLRIHRGPLPKSGTRAHDDLIPIPDSWRGRPLKDFPHGAEIDDNLLQYVRFVTRVGYEHPEYDEAMRRLSAYIATGAASR